MEISHFIEQENQRLADNVKRVLQIAELEKNSLLVNTQNLNLHQLVNLKHQQQNQLDH